MDIPWIIEEPTKIKHELLRQYISPWMAIFFSNQKRYQKQQIVIYFDGFAGPGEYFLDSSKTKKCSGSPVIVAEIANEYIDNDLQRQVVIFCIDNNQRCIELLSNTLNGINKHKQQWKVYQANFDTKINDMLGEMELTSLIQQPLFFFIDPFGYAGYPLATLFRILKYPRSELFINFMVYDMVRFWEQDHAEDIMEKLFGSMEFKDVDKSADAEERQLFFLNLYSKNLVEKAGAKYVMPFRVNTPGQGIRPRYYLIHVSQHKKALCLMKDNMARVSHVTYRFEAIGVKTAQMSLFEDPEKVGIRDRILKYCEEKRECLFENVKEWAYCNTNGVSKPIKEALMKLESDEYVEIKRAKGQKKNTVNTGAIIRYKGVKNGRKIKN